MLHFTLKLYLFAHTDNCTFTHKCNHKSIILMYSFQITSRLRTHTVDSPAEKGTLKSYWNSAVYQYCLLKPELLPLPQIALEGSFD